MDAAIQGDCRWCGQVIDPNMQAHAIVQEVADEHRVPIDDIYGRSQIAHIVSARHCAIRRVRDETGLSTTRIGELFGRDHSTIIHHLNGRNGTGARERPSGAKAD